MKKNIVVVGLCVGLVLIGGAGYWLGKTQSATTTTNPPSSAAPGGSQSAAKPGSGPGGTAAGGGGISIEASKVKTVRMSQGLTAVGSLRSDESVTIRPEVSGRISEIGFREGQRVKKGATLIRFDTSVQRAELEQASANLGLSKSRLERSRDLFTKGFISAQARDETESNFKLAQADNAAERRFDFEFAQARFGKIVACLREFEIAFGFVACLRRNEAFGEQVARPLQSAFT